MAKREAISETQLYAPVKTFLENQGYEVKGEVGAADIVAVRVNKGQEERVEEPPIEEPPVIVELKTGFSLTLFHQAIERQAISDIVYICVPMGLGRAWLSALKRNQKLCRRLGLGLLSVRLKDGFVQPHLDPAPYAPKISKKKGEKLLREFHKRQGDPNLGGHSKGKIVTAYRQDAMLCAQYLLAHGPSKAALVAKETDVQRARAIMYDNHYGWFQAHGKGIYGLNELGQNELKTGAQNKT